MRIVFSNVFANHILNARRSVVGGTGIHIGNIPFGIYYIDGFPQIIQNGIKHFLRMRGQ